MTSKTHQTRYRWPKTVRGWICELFFWALLIAFLLTGARCTVNWWQWVWQ